MPYLIVFLITVLSLKAQEAHKKVKIFYDCQADYCEITYLKQNLQAVEFVRDRNFADVHIIVLSEQNGSGGYVFHLNFIGQNNFIDIQQKYDFSVGTDATQDDIRNRLLKYLQLGLVPFWSRTGLADKLEIKLNTQKQNKENVDKWHHWIFKIGGHAWFNGDSNSGSRDLTGYAKATKVDKQNKFAFSLRYNTGQNRYTFNGQEIKSSREFFYINTYRVWGINQHWSYGIFGQFNRSKFRNYAQSYSLFGGLEYNLFPYKESASKSLVWTLKAGSLYNNYFEKTVYNKTEEILWRASLMLNGNLVKKWGSIYAGIDYATYLHDLKLYAVGFNLGTNLRIAKGLDFNTNAYYGIQHDQINIAAGNLTLEETLLAQKQLQSGYDYYFSIGLSYSFGSIYNSIVNPRFDNDSGGSRSCYCF